MATRAPSWMKKAGVALAAGVAMVVVLARALDLKKLLISQVAVPHGPLGELTARAMPMAHKMFYGPAADRLQLRPDDVLLDVACGSGVFLDDHAAHVGRIAGLDLSRIQVELARRRLRDRIQAGTAEIVLGDATALPWGEGTFTAAVCVGSLDYFADAAAALREMHRVLRPGGRMLATYGLDEHNDDIARQAAGWGLPTPSEAEACELVEHAGFALTSVSYLSGDYPVRYIQGVKPE